MSFEFNDDAFDEIKEGLEELEGGKDVPLPELLTPAFMRRYTDFCSADEMLEKSPFTVETTQDFIDIAEDEWDEFVADRTRFSSWEEMLGSASQDYIADNLGL